MPIQQYLSPQVLLFSDFAGWVIAIKPFSLSVAFQRDEIYTEITQKFTLVKKATF